MRKSIGATDNRERMCRKKLEAAGCCCGEIHGSLCVDVIRLSGAIAQSRVVCVKKYLLPHPLSNGIVCHSVICDSPLLSPTGWRLAH